MATKSSSETGVASHHVPQNTPKPRESKSSKASKIKKNVFISHSTESDYLERKFVTEFVSTLKTEYNLENDLWFDIHEKCLFTSSWMSLRLENAEKCKCAVVVLSNAYMDNR